MQHFWRRFFTDGGAPAKAAEPVTVKVGAYEYGVVYYFENGKPNGMVPLLIGLLNGLQDDYEFQLVETSSRRRYKALVDGDVDLLFSKVRNGTGRTTLCDFLTRSSQRKMFM